MGLRGRGEIRWERELGQDYTEGAGREVTRPVLTLAKTEKM